MYKRKKKKSTGSSYLYVGAIVGGVLLFLLYNFLWFKVSSFPTPETTNSKRYTVLLVANSEIYGEKQEAFHNCKAINNLGSDCHILEFGLGIYTPEVLKSYFSFVQKKVSDNIEPDFILYTFPYMLFEKSDYITYGTLDVGQYESLQMDDGEEQENDILYWVGLYDNFIIYGNNKEWNKKIISALSNRFNSNPTNFLYSFYPTVPKTEFRKSERKKLFYSGTNWDAKRFSEHFKSIFQNLDEKPYFEVYGRNLSWNFLSKSYKGEIAFDADSFVNTIQKDGIALLFHSDKHIKYGIPSKRIFEAAAAGAVIISDRNPFVEKEFGNCVLYVDTNQKPTQVANAIDKFVRQIHSDPVHAETKAKCVYEIFSKKYSLENQWKKVFAMHEKFTSTQYD